MRNLAILLAAIVTAAAFAGCAGETDDGNDNNNTTGNNNATPTRSSPSPTATPTNPASGGEDGNETDEGDMPPMLDCTPPAATNATPGSRAGYPEVVFTVKEGSDADPCYGFVGPSTVAAGWTVVTLRNDGKEPHIMPMYKLGEGKNLSDFKAALMDENASAPPAWITAVGGVGVATPFSSGSNILNLTPGKYVVICFFNGHHFSGMYRELTVTAASNGTTPAPEPTANYTIEMKDFAFVVPNMTAGTHVVKFQNVGNQSHEAPLIRLQGNATMQQFLQAIESPTGPPPGAGIGGINEIAPGEHAYGLLTLTEGNYGLVCFVEDRATGAPHFAHGMITQFSVAATNSTA